MRRQYEGAEQEAVVSWCFYNRILIFAIPNGGSRNKLEAANLKRQGVKAGVPDLFVPVARRGFHVLFIEMKHGRNTTTAKQEEWLDALTHEGYATGVCWGYSQAVELIKWYFAEDAKE